MFAPDERDGLHVQSLEHFHNSDSLPESVEDEATQFARGRANTDIRHNCSSKTLQGVHPQRRNPFGLSPLAFGALIVFMTTLIVSTVVGGGLGAALAGKEDCNAMASSAPSTSSVKPSKSPSPTSNTPTTFVNYIAPEPTLIQSLYSGCPALNDTIVQDTMDHRYRVACGRHLIDDFDTTTLTELVAYSLQDCVQACSLLNVWSGQSNCSAVSWNNAMAYSYETIGGNCWLFNNASFIALDANSTTAILEQ